MQRGPELGPQLVGEKISVNSRMVLVTKLLGEGGFSFVYLAKDISEPCNIDSSILSSEGNDATRYNNPEGDDIIVEKGTGGKGIINGKFEQNRFVLKITSIHSRHQRDIAEKEAKLLSRLSHPSIVRMTDSCYRSTEAGGKHGKLSKGGGSSSGPGSASGNRPQHLILMEYCEGGTALSACQILESNKKKFDLPSLIIAFGQICNAVSYLHAQRPPIVHRDLKPVNFLVQNGAYKLCDFGSAVFGHVDLRTPRARAEAEEVIEKTTTQMFRSPEMVDLYMSKKLTQSTDVWALGCCLFSLAFFQNCFEEGSNLAILSRNYKIPENNPYDDSLVDLIDRMLTVNCKERADMTEVILCLSAIYSSKPLPPRKRAEKVRQQNKKNGEEEKKKRVGKFRTDGQGIHTVVKQKEMSNEAKPLNKNSAAARRLEAARTSNEKKDSNEKSDLNGAFETSFSGFDFKSKNESGGKDQSFSTTDALFDNRAKASQNVNDPLSFKNFNIKSEEPIEDAFESFSSDNVTAKAGCFDSFLCHDEGNNDSLTAFNMADIGGRQLSSTLLDSTQKMLGLENQELPNCGFVSNNNISSDYDGFSDTSKRGRPIRRGNSELILSPEIFAPEILADIDIDYSQKNMTKEDKPRSKSLTSENHRKLAVDPKKKPKKNGIKGLF